MQACDGQTDRHRAIAYTTLCVAYASRGKTNRVVYTWRHFGRSTADDDHVIDTSFQIGIDRLIDPLVGVTSPARSDVSAAATLLRRQY